MTGSALKNAKDYVDGVRTMRTDIQVFVNCGDALGAVNRYLRQFGLTAAEGTSEATEYMCRVSESLPRVG